MTDPVVTYDIEFDVGAAKYLKKLARGDRDSAKRILDKISALSADPRPVGYEPVRTRPGHFRVRAGDYRIIYSIDDDKLIVLVVDVGHRSDVYDK